MYDRKTWIVVGICAVLLALNLHFSSQRAEQIAREKAAESAAETAAEPATDGSSEPVTGELRPAEPDPADRIEVSTYTLETSKVIFEFTSLGGGVRSATLKDHASLDDPDRQVVLNDGGAAAIGALAEGPDRMERVNYRYLAEDSIPGEKLVFAARHPSGLVVRKTWSRVPEDQPGSPYRLRLALDLQNSASSKERLPLDNFSLFLGEAGPLHRGESRLTPSGFFWREDGDFHLTKASKFKGGIFSDEQSLMLETASSLEYVGISNQFFASVLKPDQATAGGIWAKPRDIPMADGDETRIAIRAGLILPDQTLEPGSPAVTLDYDLFMGPKENRLLHRIGDEWGDVMNYGWWIIGIFSYLLNYAMVYIHDVVAKISGPWSWGIAIVAVTLVVRTLMWPLYARSNRTMKRMAKLKPEMDRLKEKYPDDPAKMQQEVMGMYRKYGINPIGGCLPMLAQMPIFFGFYRMLQYAVELRGHGFLWVDDLSMPDTVATVLGFPINVLPIVMGLSSFAQMSLMPNTSGDKTQMAIMKLMPIIFLVFCYNFAAALALYWTTSNLFSIAQTWITQKMPEPELKERKGASKKSFMERMAEAAEQQQKMKQAKGRVVDSEPAKSKKPRGPRTGG